MNTLRKSISILGLCCALSGLATPTNLREQTIIVPNCLLEIANIDYQKLAQNAHTTLLTTNLANINQLTTHSYKTAKPCGKFRDVTEKWHKSALTPAEFLNKYSTPKIQSGAQLQPSYQLQHQKLIKKLIPTINHDNIWDNLTEFSGFSDRSALSVNGINAANWIKDKVKNTLLEAGVQEHAYKISAIESGWLYPQPSILLTLNPNSENNGSSNPGIVLGAHIDTLDWEKPGADDDGSGSMTLLEILRTVVAAELKFDRPVHFVWYAAEERGLVGSQYVVEHFLKQKINVSAVLQFDMTGYRYQDDPSVWMIDDNVDPDLSKFVAKLAESYAKVPVKHTQCGYQCSDHASWFNEGFAASLPAEAQFEHINPYIHTGKDTMEHLSRDHMRTFAIIALAFIGELATEVN